MTDIATIASAVSSLKAASEIAKSLVGLRDTSVLQAKTIELNALILSAQQSALAAHSDQFTLLQRVRELEAKLAEMEAWDSEKERYELTDFGCGTFAYSLKPSMDRGEPPHRICAHCYQQRRKSILQSHGRPSGTREKTVCPSCSKDVWLGCPGETRRSRETATSWRTV